MIVKAVLEWEGPAGFDDVVDIVVEPTRLGTKSFDLRYRASVEGAAVVHRRDHLRERQAVDARVGADPRPRCGPGSKPVAGRRLIRVGVGRGRGRDGGARTRSTRPSPSGSGSQYEKSR